MGFKKNGKYIPTDKRKLTHDEMIKMGISHSKAGVDKRGCVMCGSKTRNLTEHTCDKCMKSMF